VKTKAVVFDLDGTLVDSRLDLGGARQRVRQLLGKRGVFLPGDEAPLAELLSLARQAGPSLYAQALRVVAEMEAHAWPRAMPGAQEALRRLRREGYALGLLTNTGSPGARELLRRTGLEDLLDAVRGREEVPALKPSPLGLQALLADLGFPRQAWFVGDSWVDAQAAQEAGVPFLSVGARGEELARRGLAPPWKVVAHLEEAVDAILQADGTVGEHLR
jgi:phosphoglycolate phosphatase